MQFYTIKPEPSDDFGRNHAPRIWNLRIKLGKLKKTKTAPKLQSSRHFDSSNSKGMGADRIKGIYTDWVKNKCNKLNVSENKVYNSNDWTRNKRRTKTPKRQMLYLCTEWYEKERFCKSISWDVAWIYLKWDENFRF